MDGGGPAFRFWLAARRTASTLVARFWRGMSAGEAERRLAARPLRDQIAIVGGVLAALFLTSLLFANGGFVGFLLFLLLVVIVVN
ncbi:hypothetical protein [Rhodobacter sp. NSM]|uniref:hypothetical protein n=1 Tax=Rhodobacter sp. NSM TaxID=3457501 RepID=UPI003FD5A633